MADNFKVYGHKPEGWDIGEPREKYLIDNGVEEPATGVDAAEEWLAEFGVPGQSYVELVFADDVHTTVFMLEDGVLGIFNSEDAEWPVFYATGDSNGVMLDGYPVDFIGETVEVGHGKEDDDSEIMNIGDAESEDDDGDDEEDGAEEEDADNAESDPMDEQEEDEAAEEAEEDAEGEDNDSGNEDENAEDESDDDMAEEGEDESEDEEESEVPRLNIFAKMRGPKGWRKRAEAEELLERNVFALKVGVLDPEAATPGTQEKEIVAHIEFIESAEHPEFGLLRMKLPDGIDPDEFDVTKSGWITAKVYYREGNGT